jgi:hypothetical protein
VGDFTSSCKHQATSAWRAVGVVHNALIMKPAQSKRERPAVERVERGCLYMLIFWIPGIVTLIRYMFAGIVISLVAAYALIVSVTWGIAVIVDAIGHRGNGGRESRLEPATEGIPGRAEERSADADAGKT